MDVTLFRRLVILLGLILAVSSISSAQTYVVDGPGSLTSTTNLIKSSIPGGVRRVQFKTYQDVGSFSVDGITVDSLIFERFEESAEAINVSGKMFQIQGAAGPVVFRNLAFKLTSGSSVLVEGVGSSSNKNLLFDSCVIFGDSIGSTFISWATSAGSHIELRRCIFAGLKGSDGKIDLNSDSIRITNNYFNYSGLVSAVTPKGFELLNNSTNRTQFDLNGKFTGGCSIQRNLFGYPPSVNKLPGDPKKYAMTLLGFSTSAAQGNARFDSWSGFDYATVSAFAEAQNPSITSFGDTSALWKFQQPGDLQRGYQNPPTAAFPAFSIFPGDTLFKAVLGSDSLYLTLASASIPRVISISPSTAAYPAALDSTRSFWKQDTVLQVNGPATVKSIGFPQSKSYGPPVLFSQVAGVFQPGPVGKDGDLVFQNGSAAAKVFLPVFTGQNTSKGTQVFVRGLSSDTLLRIATVTRAGKTRLIPPQLGAGKKRWRIIKQGNQVLGFKDSTTAEGLGTLRFGLAKAGFPSPFSADSLSWLFPGDSLRAVTDSAGKYWGDANLSITNQAVLIERLGLGAGKDTLPLTQGRLISVSSVGIQVKVDSSGVLPIGQLSDMAYFSKPITVTWIGRQAGDTLQLEWGKSQPQQKAFLFKGGKSTALIPIREDSNQVTLTLGLGDSVGMIFLARKYSIPAGIKTTLMVGIDSVKDVLSSNPGELMLDTNVSLQGLPVDSLRVLLKRRVSVDNLQITGTYSLMLKGLAPNREENLRAYLRHGAKWDSIAVVHGGSFYNVIASQADSQFVIAEILKSIDTLPVSPTSNPSIQAQNGIVSIKPVLSPSETARLQSYSVVVFSVDIQGRAHLDTIAGLAGDSTVNVVLAGGKYYTAQIGYVSYSGRVTWKAMTVLPQDAKAFLSAAAAAARPYKPAVWELLSLPWNGTPGSDIRSRFSTTDQKNVHIEGWMGKWTPLADSAALARGRGYLVGFPKAIQPTAPSSFSFAFAPESLSLDTGWQLVASPYPFAFSEISIQKDPKVVSVFYALGWDGSGDTAKPVWTVADTLKPFFAYAVHTTTSTKLRFDPTQLGKPASSAKIATVDQAEIRVTGLDGDLKAQLFVRPIAAPRPSPAPPFFTNGLLAHWQSATGPITTGAVEGRALDLEAVLCSPDPRLVTVSTPNGVRPLALWNPRMGTLTALSGNPTLPLAMGENWFRILEVSPKDMAATEAALRQKEISRFELLPNYPNPFSGRTTVVFTIPLLAGTQSKVLLQVVGLDGRIRSENQFRDVAPGRFTVPVDGSAWPPGEYILQATLQGGGQVQRFQRKLVHLGGGQ